MKVAIAFSVFIVMTAYGLATASLAAECSNSIPKARKHAVVSHNSAGVKKHSKSSTAHRSAKKHVKKSSKASGKRLASKGKTGNTAASGSLSSMCGKSDAKTVQQPRVIGGGASMETSSVLPSAAQPKETVVAELPDLNQSLAADFVTTDTPVTTQVLTTSAPTENVVQQTTHSEPVQMDALNDKPVVYHPSLPASSAKGSTAAAITATAAFNWLIPSIIGAGAVGMIVENRVSANTRSSAQTASTPEPTPVPEPSAWVSLGLGASGLIIGYGKKRFCTR